MKSSRPRMPLLLLPLVVVGVPFVWSAAPNGSAVTVYTSDLAFVRENRTLELRSARDTVRLEDVPERIDFGSVRLSPQGAKVARLAYRYDVASGDGALERARGGRVSVALRDNRAIDGTLLAADGAWLVVREENGSLHTLSRASVDDVRIVDPGQSLALRPALEAVIEGSRGKVEAELAYLTGGMSWSAEHTLVRSGENKATWSAAVTIQNNSGRDYPNAKLKLVAGDPHRATPSPMPMVRGMAMEMSMAKSADLSEETFSEYHLYTLDRPATLRDRETQTLSMLAPRQVTVTPRYLYRGGDPRGVRAQLEVVNSKAAGLGEPLPGGRVRFYETDAAGDLQFTGEAALAHTPEGEKLTLEVGAAFDLAAERRETANRRIADREREYSIEVKVRNRKKADASIVIEEPLGGDSEITQKSHPFTQKDANTIQFTVPVKAGAEVVVTYTARVRF